MQTQPVVALLIIYFSSAAVCAIEYKRGLTDHFISWLNDTGGYEPYNFNRTEFFGGSFGGKENDDSIIKHRPVIFIHGNQDMLIGDNPENNGFRLSIEYFLA